MGDRLEAVNDAALQDLIDYRFQTAEHRVRLRIWRGDEALEIDVAKDPDEDLGLAFDEAVFDRVRQCANKCEFCFIVSFRQACLESAPAFVTLVEGCERRLGDGATRRGSGGDQRAPRAG